MKKSLALAMMLLPGLVHAQDQADLSHFDNFRSYPYLDHAYRAADEHRWADVQRLMEHLIARVPGNLEAHRLLAQSLQEQGDIEGALAALHGLDTNMAVTQRLALQEGWINSGHATPDQVRQWLQETTGSGRERLWRSEAEHLRATRGAGFAADWLGEIGNGNDLPLDRYRASLAESAQDWPTVVDTLTPHAQRGELNDNDWQRLISGLVGNRDAPGLDRLLEAMPDDQRAIALNEAAQHAIALGHPRLAERWLKQLDRLGALDETTRAELEETALQVSDVGTVRDLALHNSDNCLSEAVWLADHSVEDARKVLRQCPPGQPESAATWLNLAARLDTLELIENTPLPATLNDQRTMVLVHGYARRHDWQQALEWLQAVPSSPERWQLEAELATRAGDPLRAARAWQAHYRLTDDPRSLETASYQLTETGHHQDAIALLQTVLQQHPEHLAPRTIERLADLYRQSPESLDATTLTSITARLSPEQRRPLMESLAYAQRCDLITPLAESMSPTPWRAMALCAEDQSGQAVVLWQKALDQSLDEHDPRLIEDNRRALAYALSNAGDNPGAWQQWQQIPWQHLDAAAHEAETRSALAIGATEDAWALWQDLDASSSRIRLLGAHIAMARGENAHALELARSAVTPSPTNPDDAGQLVEASAVAANVGDDRLATQWLEQAWRLAPDSPLVARQLGINLAAADDAPTRQRAVSLLEQASRDYPEDFMVTSSLANLEFSSGNYASTRHWLRRSIDLQSEDIAVGGAKESVIADRRYGQRRMHESLSRRDSVRISSSWAPTLPSAGIYNKENNEENNKENNDSGGGINSQILEWDHALGDEPWHDGRQLAVYGRAILGGSEGDNDSHHSYADSQSLGLGLRARPFATHNLNLYAELYADHSDGGDSDLDVMLRANTSLFDQGDYSSEWRSSETHWNERSLYLDSAWWIHREFAQVYARYQQGHTFKLGTTSAQTLMPYVAAQFTSQRGNGWDSDSRVAAGVRWQLWYDEDRYNAYRRKLTIGTEFQRSVSGELYGGNHGWALNLELDM